MLHRNEGNDYSQIAQFASIGSQAPKTFDFLQEDKFL